MQGSAHGLRTQQASQRSRSGFERLTRHDGQRAQRMVPSARLLTDARCEQQPQVPPLVLGGLSLPGLLHLCGRLPRPQRPVRTCPAAARLPDTGAPVLTGARSRYTSGMHDPSAPPLQRTQEQQRMAELLQEHMARKQAEMRSRK